MTTHRHSEHSSATAPGGAGGGQRGCPQPEDCPSVHFLRTKSGKMFLILIFSVLGILFPAQSPCVKLCAGTGRGTESSGIDRWRQRGHKAGFVLCGGSSLAGCHLICLCSLPAAPPTLAHSRPGMQPPVPLSSQPLGQWLPWVFFSPKPSAPSAEPGIVWEVLKARGKALLCQQRDAV